MNTASSYIYVTLISTTPEKLWAALTQPEFTRRYWFDTDIESDWKVGSPVDYRCGDGFTTDGVIKQCEPPSLLAYTFHDLTSEEASAEAPSLVTFKIEPLGSKRGPLVKLTVVHDKFPAASKVLPKVSGGWPLLLSSLKTLLETGAPIEIDFDAPCTK
jgi:uncharacterized protein YndB with AHSA1/START domain